MAPELRKRCDLLNIKVSNIGIISKFLGEQWHNYVTQAQRDFFEEKANEEDELHHATYPWYSYITGDDRKRKSSRVNLADVDMPGYLRTEGIAQQYHEFCRINHLPIMHPVKVGDANGLDQYNVPGKYYEALAKPSETRTKRLRQAKYSARKANKTTSGQSPAQAAAARVASPSVQGEEAFFFDPQPSGSTSQPADSQGSQELSHMSPPQFQAMGQQQPIVGGQLQMVDNAQQDGPRSAENAPDMQWLDDLVLLQSFDNNLEQSSTPVTNENPMGSLGEGSGALQLQPGNNGLRIDHEAMTANPGVSMSSEMGLNWLPDNALPGGDGLLLYGNEEPPAANLMGEVLAGQLSQQVPSQQLESSIPLNVEDSTAWNSEVEISGQQPLSQEQQPPADVEHFGNDGLVGSSLAAMPLGDNNVAGFNSMSEGVDAADDVLYEDDQATLDYLFGDGFAL
ncbi:hypothetical protein GGS26DRAFT_545782 [Hypomontagnella submonticulosa]|nr:hypothetical protein GGS26DRAFT_545782 [Hypomontagnella submonticulosa]